MSDAGIAIRKTRMVAPLLVNPSLAVGCMMTARERYVENEAWPASRSNNVRLSRERPVVRAPRDTTDRPDLVSPEPCSHAGRTLAVAVLAQVICDSGSHAVWRLARGHPEGHPEISVEL